MMFFVPLFALLLVGAVLCLVIGIRKKREGLLILSVCGFLLLLAAWVLLGYFLTRM
ncbi:hypothetical protein [uncultured Neglectibacter sp.]|uniref:hypothetical protein n=1 Tax=uncultured Neglectibacter sp. TaxID=1924108 RepID=UPI0034DEA519